MNIYGRTSVSEFLGDNVVYRNLEPVDDRLPILDDLRADLGLPADRVPRKSESDSRTHFVARFGLMDVTVSIAPV